MSSPTDMKISQRYIKRKYVKLEYRMIKYFMNKNVYLKRYMCIITFIKSIGKGPS